VGTNGPILTVTTVSGEVGTVGPPSRGTPGNHLSGNGKHPDKHNDALILTPSRVEFEAVEDERLDHLDPIRHRLATLARAEIAAGATRDATALYETLVAAEGIGADGPIREALVALIDLGEVRGAPPSRYRSGGAS
jgi:hypothetical protein